MVVANSSSSSGRTSISINCVGGSGDDQVVAVIVVAAINSKVK